LRPAAPISQLETFKTDDRSLRVYGGHAMRVLERRETGKCGDVAGRHAPRARDRAVPNLHPMALALVGATGRWWQRVLRDLLEPYRPELHYMRGPGPKWRAKHVGPAAVEARRRRPSLNAE